MAGLAEGISTSMRLCSTHPGHPNSGEGQFRWLELRTEPQQRSIFLLEGLCGQASRYREQQAP
jgi:hypothetical protein